MADKPIIFSAPMIQALLDGRKTQTRRVAKIKDHLADHTFTGDLVNYYGDRRLGMRVEGSTLVQPIPYAPGDRLWVRENCATWEGGHRYVVYRSDLSDKDWSDLSHDARNGAPWKRRPSIHMPRWASRLTLTVTDVRVQRLQEISEADAKAEGVTPVDEPNERKWQHYSPHGVTFKALWNSLHGPDAWDANPWVTAISFDVHRCNIDQMENPNG